MKVPASECTAANGVIRHTPVPAGRRTYGKWPKPAAKTGTAADVKLKDPKDWKIAGKPLKRLDTSTRLLAHDLRHRRQAAGLLNPRSRIARYSAAS